MRPRPLPPVSRVPAHRPAARNGCTTCDIAHSPVAEIRTPRHQAPVPAAPRPRTTIGDMNATTETSLSRRVTLAVVSLATAMLMLDIAVVNTALPDIQRDLHTGLSGIQWVVDAYTLALATVVLTAGSLADRLGRRRMFLGGLGIFPLSSLAAALADSIVVLDTARAVQGIGAAVMFAVSLALLAHAFPGKRERAGALAVYGATIGASFAVGPLVGGALTSGIDWRAIFLVNVPLGLLAIAATIWQVRESRDPQARSIDWAGQAVLGGGLFLLVLALLRGND